MSLDLPKPGPQYDPGNESQARSAIARAVDQLVKITGFTFSNLKEKPTTLAGYGITDALASSILAQGAWTPVLRGDTTAGSVTYTGQTGSYEKIGRLVIARFRIVWTAFSGASGIAEIGGLPFASTSATNDTGTLVVGQVNGINFGSGFTQLGGRIDPGAAVAPLVANESNTGATFVSVANVSASGALVGCAIYRTN